MHSASALIFYIYIYFREIPGSSSELFRRKLHEWVFNVVRSLYSNYFCKVSVNDEYSDEFPVKGGVDQSSYLCPLLFIFIPLKMSTECSPGSPQEIMYADDFVLILETLEDLSSKLIQKTCLLQRFESQHG